MSKGNKDIRQLFWENFAKAAEEALGMSRDDWGFMREIKKSLNLPRESTAQRWFKGAMPRIPYLVRIYETWGVTPNHLLGINGAENSKKEDRVQSTKLHTLFSALDIRKRKGLIANGQHPKE